MKFVLPSLRIWLIANLLFGMCLIIFLLLSDFIPFPYIFIPFILSVIGSFPALFIVFFAQLAIAKTAVPFNRKKEYLMLVCGGFCALYGIAAIVITAEEESLLQPIIYLTTGLVASAIAAIELSVRQLATVFNHSFIIQPQPQMEPSFNPASSVEGKTRSNRIVIKAGITGILILLMLIPTLFISNLVTERRQRQAEVVREVSQRWAEAQVLTGPYISVPYKKQYLDKDKKMAEEVKTLILLPDVLDVKGNISHELRERSIYKVLLYRAELQNTGNFQFQVPKEIDSTLIQWQDTRICFGLSDFKGIEEKMVVRFNGADYEFTPGLPSNAISEKGLSASIPLTASESGTKLSFAINYTIKGSEQLHFVPLSGDSKFTLRSTWPDPSFDGSNLPSERTVNDSGFTASWNFNKANLPFGTALTNFDYEERSLAFGVTLIQPTDGYSKTARCIKYAILFIGLTFSLFFIVELMQKRPVHPVQYILIGLALVIFYTLLLSISEFVVFDMAYLVSAAATILLISFYAYGHFRSLQTAGIFAGVLTLLYGFTFVLIRLEDTALLLGSIGLFIILALAMYASRKINWYGEDVRPVTV